MSEETFEALLAPQLQWVRSFVRARLRTIDDADDVVQQTLLRAFVCRDQLRCASKFRSWLWSIAANEIRAFFRAQRPCISLEQGANGDLVDPAPSALAACERMEDDERLRAGMESLTTRDRMAIRLVDLNGWSYSQAAGAMAVSKAAFKSTHFRARQRLGRALCMPSEPAKERGAVVRLTRRRLDKEEFRSAA
jgi:RNA polymerase sigma-70 factor (ECF subfamily)